MFSSVNFPCPSLSSGQLPCVTAHLPPPAGMPRQACGSGLPLRATPKYRGRAAREPIRFEKHPQLYVFL